MAGKAKTLVRSVRVFDGATFLPQLQDVLIAAGAIESLTATDTSGAETPSDTEVIDGTGHTLTPGIIDCHVHVCISDAGSLTAFTEPFSLQFYKSVTHLQRTLHAGVTTARDAGGSRRRHPACARRRAHRRPRPAAGDLYHVPDRRPRRRADVLGLLDADAHRPSRPA